MATLRTVTLSTGFDDHYTVEGFAWGGVGRTVSFASVPSGKGISCARAARDLRLPVKAYAALGRDDAALYRARTDAEGLDTTLVEVAGPIRHNLTIIDAAGQHTAAHLMGDRPPQDPAEVAPLFDRLLADVQPGDIVTLNGALPPGLAPTTWADLVAALESSGARVIVDAQDQAFTACLDGPRVTAFKPNTDEIRALPGVEAADDPVAAALRVLQPVARIPLVTLAGDGVATLVDGRVLRLSCPVGRPVVSVMAGDTFVAGMGWALLKGDADPETVLSHGLAAAAAYVAGTPPQQRLARATANLSRVERAPLGGGPQWVRA